MIVLLERAQLAPGMNVVLADPRQRSFIKRALQLAAVNGKLRVVIARVKTSGLAPENLAESIGIDQLMGANRHTVELGKEAEFCQFFNRVREYVNADAEFSNAARLLKYLALDPGGVQT